MAARTCNVAAELAVGGINVQVLDYRWNAGEQITELEKDFILRYRAFPAEISVAARLHEGALQNFGQLMFFPADVPIETDAADSNERTRNVMCRFSADWFQRVWNVNADWDSGEIARCMDMRNVRVEQAIQRLGMEASCPGFASPLLAESLSTVIAVEIARHFNGEPESFRVRTRDGILSQGDLNRIYEFVESFSNKCPSIDDIARQCDISPAHLRRSFKKTTGRTVHHYVEEIRLKKAQQLLAETDLPLKEVSYRLGFADSSTFSSTFRKTSGETPSGYRYRHRQ